MATNGDRFAIACRPFRHNSLPRILVKVLPDGSTICGGCQPGLKLVKPDRDRFPIVKLKHWVLRVPFITWRALY
jgi:hypothetical protein